MKINSQIIKDESQKREIINSLSAQGSQLFFCYEEDPLDYLNSSIKFKKLGDAHYLISPPYSYDELEKWLYIGNWIAADSNKVLKPIDVFKSNDKDIEKYMDEFKLTILIDSFHDDIEWKVVRR